MARQRNSSRDEMLKATAATQPAPPPLNSKDRKRPESFNSEKRAMQQRLEATQPRMTPTSVLFLAGMLTFMGLVLYNALITSQSM
eukprot:3179261-Prymnesium_polylepis.2